MSLSDDTCQFGFFASESQNPIRPQQPLSQERFVSYSQYSDLSEEDKKRHIDFTKRPENTPTQPKKAKTPKETPKTEPKPKIPKAVAKPTAIDKRLLLAKYVSTEENKLYKPDSSREAVNIVFIGHVDAGKSTICGQILLLTGKIDQRLVELYTEEAKAKGRDSW